MRNPKIPEAAIKRLPVYLRILGDLIGEEVEIVSSADLAGRTGFSPEQIRKDLAYFGAFGTRGVGYDTEILSRRIKRILGLHKGVNAVLVGAGNLGTALARYSLAKHKDVRIVAIFDNDWDKIGKEIQGVEIQPLDDLCTKCHELNVRIGIITVPAPEAQSVADVLVRAGIEAILNFSPSKLKVPPGVYVQNIDLTIELQSLAYYTSMGVEPDLDVEMDGDDEK
ncbi:MAG: redox-sensing transcriptional repressor Rex [Bacillota bacterium]